MTLLLLLAAILLLAVLAPLSGVDSRRLDDREGPTRDKLWSRNS